jgi:hypothetical protein
MVYPKDDNVIITLASMPRILSLHFYGWHRLSTSGAV